MQASRNFSCISVEAVKRCHSSLGRQGALCRHSSFMQASPASTDPKLYQMVNLTFFKTFSNFKLLFGRYVAAPASGCVFIVRLNQHQMFDSIFIKTSSNFKLHLLARSILTAFAACLFSNHCFAYLHFPKT